MEKKKVTYKEILLIIGYIIIVGVYQIFSHFGLIPRNSFIGVFLEIFALTSITLVYLVLVQKKTTIKIISHIKILLPWLAIPTFMSFLILATLPYFLPVRSNLFDVIVILVVIGTAISWLVIMRILSKRTKASGSDR